VSSIYRSITVITGLLLLWDLLVRITQVPTFIFPAPLTVASTFAQQYLLLLEHSLTTALEILAGLFIGSILGVGCALILTAFSGSRRWALPLMVISQALPVFAMAPLLTLWFGYGMSSKIAMAVLIIYFPVVAATFDGLRHTPTAMVDLAKTLDASSWSILWQVRLPAACPSIASGVRVATSVAPIGAVVGEWVGSSHGLGYLMLHASGRMQTDLLFAALLCLCLIALALYLSINSLLDRCLYWQADTSQIPVSIIHK